MSASQWFIVLLADHHQRGHFDCGEAALNAYLKNLAGQHARKNISRTYVAVPKDAPAQVLGFYTLSMAQVTYGELPLEMRRKLPQNYPVPTARLGRLAVDVNAQGQGIGRGLLMNALVRCAKIAEEMGVAGVIVDVRHQQAKVFYEKYGFISLVEMPMALFIPIQSILKSIPSVILPHVTT